MHVLVAAASRHGSTTEIATAIGDQLTRSGFRADVLPLKDVSSLDDYDAVVLGCAVYVGRWLAEAVDFVEAHAATLSDKPVWLFSSGPLGHPEPMPRGDPEGISEISERIGARGHRTFSGRIDRGRLSLGEKIIVGVVRAPEGDFRDWPAITSWAAGIAQELGRIAKASRSQLD
jgi:menaquinone-dependent protoporphyrinogen oxidase